MNIIDLFDDPDLFKPWFDSPSWSAWRTFLKTLFDLPFDAHDQVTYSKHTQRATAPMQAFREAWLVVGRRAGKTLTAAAIAVFLACFKNYSAFLQPGETGTVMLIAADRKQARSLMRYIKGFLDSVDLLRELVL